MKKKIIKGIIMLGIIIAFNICFTNISRAELKISPSKSTVEAGEKFNVVVSVASNEASKVDLTVTNGELSTSQVDLMSQNSVTITCKAGTSGNVTISGSGLVANYDNETEKKQSASAKVTIKTNDTNPGKEDENEQGNDKSSDTSLKSLTVSPFGNLKSPYDITVDNKYDKVTISAVPNHSKAKVSGTGEFSLKDGTNHFEITVTAEDGTKKSYGVYIRRKAEEKNEPISPPNVIDESEEEEQEPKKEENVKTDFGLSNLVITGVELNPSFEGNIYEYKAELSENIDTLEIIANANENDAEIEIVGNTNLKVGENLITIIVTSKDGKKTATYQIIVDKKEPDIVATNSEVGETQDSVKSEQELKKSIGKIILIAAAAIIAVILIGIIAIAYTKKNREDDFIVDSVDKKKKNIEKVGKNDFKIAINEEDAYKDLEKLSNIHNKHNRVEEVQEEVQNDINKENETVNDKIDNMNIFDKKNVKEEFLKSYNDIEQDIVEKNINEDLFYKNKKSKGKRFK